MFIYLVDMTIDQARPTLMYPYPGSGPLSLPPSGPPSHYDEPSSSSRYICIIYRSAVCPLVLEEDD